MNLLTNGVASFGESAASLLAQFETILPTFGITIPDRAYVAPGSFVPWDEESLTVAFGSLGQGDAGSPTGAPFRLGQITFASVSLNVQLLRKIPVTGGAGARLRMPSTADLNDSGVSAFNDVAALMLTAVQIHSAWSEISSGQSMVVGPASMLGPDGGMTATRIHLELSVS